MMAFTKQVFEELTSCESSDGEENMLNNEKISTQQWASIMNLLPKKESHPGEYSLLRSCMESLLHLPMNRKTYKVANCKVFKLKYKFVKYEVSQALNLVETDQKVVDVYNSCRFTFFACLVAFMSQNIESYAPYEKDTTSFEDLYQNSHFANKADPNLFRNLSVPEIKFLSKYREMMQLALVLIPPKYNKELLKNVCAMLEGSNKKYITGGKNRATPETLRRVFLFEHYGGIKPEIREYRRAPSPASGSGSPKRKCESESCCSSSDDETSSVTSASSSGSASKRVRVQVKQSVEEKVVSAVVEPPALHKAEKEEEEEEMFSSFHGWSEEDEQDFRSVIENLSLGEEDETDKLFAEVLRDERELNFEDDFDTIAWF